MIALSKDARCGSGFDPLLCELDSASVSVATPFDELPRDRVREMAWLETELGKAIEG